MNSRPRILCLAWDEQENASARCRIFALARWLGEQGYDARAMAPVGGTLGHALARPGAARRARRAIYRALQFARVGARLREASRADMIILQREMFPFGPPSAERRLFRLGRPVIYDLDDAMHIKPTHFRTATHRLHSYEKFEEIARKAASVVVSSRALEEWAESIGVRAVRIPTAVDTDFYRPVANRSTASAPVLGWTGTAGNLAHLESIRPALAAAAERFPFVLRIIGEKAPAWRTPRVEFVPWSLERERIEVPRFDVGLMPLIDSPYARAKAGYKALVYMACGVPPILSPVGTNVEIVEHGVDGFLARDHDEWIETIGRLLGDADLRREVGARARMRVEREGSIDAQFPRFLEILSGVAG